MGRLLHLPQGTVLLSEQRIYSKPSKGFELITRKLSHTKGIGISRSKFGIKSSLKGITEVVDRSLLKVNDCGGLELVGFPAIQTLSEIPKEEVADKVVFLVRFDSKALLGEKLNQTSQSVNSAVNTIKCLHEIGAKVILVSDWSKEITLNLVAGILSSVLQCKVVVLRHLSSGTVLKREALKKADTFLLENLSEFKGEVANCPKFAELISSQVDIFVNDAWSQSHKVLASTVGVTRFCYGCVAGFHFQECLYQLRNAVKANKRPYVCIIGGGKIHDKASALKILASECDGLIFVGTMSIRIMHALGQTVPSNLLERGADEAARDIVQFAQNRNIPILCPKDCFCVDGRHGSRLEIFPLHQISDGWTPVDLGPRSLEAIDKFLRNCKKVIWIGSVRLKSSKSSYTKGASSLAQMLYRLSQNEADVTVIGKTACNALTKEANSTSGVNMIERASVAWEFLRGWKLPGVMALDRAYPYKIDWKIAYRNPAQPLAVDIGSGNGLFIFGMARKRTDLNFLGLEINGKLVKRCIDSIQQNGVSNGYFIETNATSTFRSIVSSYFGELVLVSIQCPNPDFNKPEHRWRMLQRSLAEAVVDLLEPNGKVFLQSDVEPVALRMKELFLKYSKGKLVLMHNQDSAETGGSIWMEENPFGVCSDWEQHVLDGGKPMYRLMLCKTNNVKQA